MKNKAKIRIQEFKKQNVKLTNTEIQLIMLLRENYLTVNEFVESARVGAEIQAEASDNDYYEMYINKITDIHFELNVKSPL